MWHIEVLGIIEPQILVCVAVFLCWEAQRAGRGLVAIEHQVRYNNALSVSMEVVQLIRQRRTTGVVAFGQ